MELRDYLHINRLSINEFSIMINYTRNYVSSVKHGKLIPSRKFIKAVEEATKGHVTEKDIVQPFIDRKINPEEQDANNST